MESITLPERAHRTVLFVDGDSYDKDAKYAERARRLNESLNGANIKVDVVTVRNGSFVIPALTAAAKAKGYDQILFSVAASTDKVEAVPVPKSQIIKGLA